MVFYLPSKETLVSSFTAIRKHYSLGHLQPLSQHIILSQVGVKPHAIQMCHVSIKLTSLHSNLYVGGGGVWKV